MKNVAVLMSTYNGESYISEQIESIFSQDFDDKKLNLTLYVRDDGSTDQTREIVSNLSQKYNIMCDFEGPNLGFAKSFYSLLNNAEADYYFFADQDDIWTKNKLTIFFKRFSDIEKNQQFKDIGVFSDAWVANENGESIGRKLLDKRSPRIKNGNLGLTEQLFEYYAQGASMAVNHEVVEKLRLLPFTELPYKESHDHFIGLVVSYVGYLSFIDEPTLFYRQSGNNVYGARSNGKESLIKKINTIFSRVKTVQVLMLSAELVSGILYPYGDKFRYRELNKLLTKNNFFSRLQFFVKYRHYASLANPIVVAVLYALLFKSDYTLQQQIQTLIDRNQIHEDYMGTATKL